jgi:dCMP deaminase
MTRATLSEVFLKVAGSLAGMRSICPGGATGCVIATADGRIVATGYNGPPHGWNDAALVKKGCERDRLELHGGIGYEVCPCIHAEQNALSHAARHGVATDGCMAYCTRKPCSTCAKALLQAGVEFCIFLREDGFPAQSYCKLLIMERVREALREFQ